MANETTNPVPPVQTPMPGQPVYPAGTIAPPQPVYQQAPPGQQVYPAAQPVYQQPVVVAQPVVTEPVEQRGPDDHPQILLVGHSSLFFWWPVWAVGYLMAFLTWSGGQTLELGGQQAWFHPGKSMGLIFIATLFVVIMISNITLRGLASALVLTGIALVTVLFAYLGWWDNILSWLGGLNIFLNAGAYFWFATLIFVVWLFSTFVYDRMTYWRVTPGQMTQHKVFGASTKSFDTENMTFEKRRDDIFRHWLLGMGSGDLLVHAFSAGQREDIKIPNVLFIGSKIHEIQHLIATEPAKVAQHPPPA